MLKFHFSNNKCCLYVCITQDASSLWTTSTQTSGSWQHHVRPAETVQLSTPCMHHGVMVLNSLWATTAAFVRSDQMVLYYAKNSADLETRACGHKLRGCELWCNGPLFIACVQDSGADEVEWRWHLRYHLCYILFYTLTCFCIEDTTMATVREAAVEKPDLRLNHATIKQA